MDTFCVDKRVIGAEKHLCFSSDGHVEWSLDVPSTAWYYDCSFKHGLCLDTLFALEGFSLDLSVSAACQKMLTTLISGSISVPVSKVLPTQHYKNYIEKIINAVKDTYAKSSKDYFLNTWTSSSELFELLRPALIDVDKLQAYIRSSGGNKSALASFATSSDDLASLPNYNRLKTRTGRLTIDNGPNILTLNRDMRDIFRSRTGGRIMQYDFSALETRVVMYEAGLRYANVDVYSYLRDKLFNNELSRDIVKKVTISKMFGQSDKNLSAELNMSLDDVADITSRIKSFLGMNSLSERTKKFYVNHGFIRNRYGRKVFVPDPQDHIIFNSYVQSTGVDVSLQGFKKIYDDVLKPNKCKLLYLLHDAIVIDVPKGVELPNVLWVKVPGYVQTFPVKLERFSK